MKKKIVFSLIFLVTLLIGVSSVLAFPTKSNNPVDVSTPDELKEALDSSTNINIVSDLNFLEHKITGSAFYLNEYSGVINGNGYAIKNLNGALFDNLNNTNINNLIIDGSNILTDSSYAVMANNAIDSVFSNIHVINSNVLSNSNNGASGLIANASAITVNNSSITNTTIEGDKYVGAVVGRNTGTSEFNNIFIETTTIGKDYYVGGVVGYNDGSFTINNSILNNYFNSPNGTNNRGGIVGNSSGNYVYLNNVLSTTNGESPNINEIIGAGNIDGVNSYNLLNSGLKEQNYAWLTKVNQDDINDDFFLNSVLLDSNIWNIKDTNSDNLPVLKSSSIIDDYLNRKPVTPDYLNTVAELDTLIKNGYSNNISQDYEMLLMKRDLINNIGYDYLVNFASYSNENEEFLRWLITDYENLSYYTLGGSPDGTYINELNVLYMLYKDSSIRSDLESNEVTSEGNVLGDVYKKMFFSIGKGYSITVRFWTAKENDANNDGIDVGPFTSYDHPSVSNPIDRYNVFKKLHKDNLLGYQREDGVYINSNKMFENLEVEEMRYVLNAHLDDKTVEWLNWYIESEDEAAGLNEEKYYDTPNSRRNPYTYMDYRSDFNYYKDEFSDPLKFSEWDNKYKFSKFGISKLYYESPKMWTVFEGNGICWGISKTGADIWNVSGVPASAVSQPGHLAYVFSSYDDDDDKMFWGWIYNSVSNWGLTGEGGPTAMHDKFYVRMPLSWGDDSSVKGYNASYILLSQENLNNFDVYKEGYLNRLATNSFKDDLGQQEVILRNTLALNNRDYGAWLELVYLYLNDSSKTNDQYISLLEEISIALEYSPLPMYHLFNLVLPKIEDSSSHSVKYYNMLEANLNNDLLVTETDNLEYLGIKSQAEYLLGMVDTDLALFSFDGDDANKLMLSPEKFEGSQVTWDYSFDNGLTWTQVEEKSILLSDEEIEKITSKDDIKVHIVGLPYTDENIFTIDILDGVMDSNIYLNDLENRLIGSSKTLEYYDIDKNEWVKISDQRFEGNTLINVRVKAYETVLASESKEYEFTKNKNDKNDKYILIENIKFIEGSKPYNDDKLGSNFIDGNIYTNYYSLEELPQYTIFEFTSNINLTRFEYLPYPTNIGRAKAITIYGSLDGEDYTKIQSYNDIENNGLLKNFKLEKPAEVKFIKVEFTESHGGGIAGNLINFYEDETLYITELENIIKKAEELLSDNSKSEEANKLLLEKVEQAMELLESDYTKEEVDDMVNQLNQAINDFNESIDVIDISQLENKIKEIENLLLNSTKPDAANIMLQTILEEAKYLLENDYTKNDIDEMVNRINEAIFIFNNSVDKIDTTKLEDVIKKVESLLKSNNKTNQANILLEEVLKEAKELLESDYTKNDIDEMINKLNQALVYFDNSLNNDFFFEIDTLDNKETNNTSKENFQNDSDNLDSITKDKEVKENQKEIIPIKETANNYWYYISGVLGLLIIIILLIRKKINKADLA